MLSHLGGEPLNIPRRSTGARVCSQRDRSAMGRFPARWVKPLPPRQHIPAYHPAGTETRDVLLRMPPAPISAQITRLESSPSACVLFNSYLNDTPGQSKTGLAPP